MKKKINPRRRPATHADIERAKDRAAVDLSLTLQAMVFTVLGDKKGFDNDDMWDVWKGVQDLAEAINEGRVTAADLMRVLLEERGIDIRRATILRRW
jgi:hypothetical protein